MAATEKEVFVFPASFAQQRLWFLDQLEPGSHLYNIPQAIRLSGALKTEALRQSLAAIVARHESLRTTFALIDGAVSQLIAERQAVEMPVTDLSDLPEAEREAEVERLAQAEAQRPFDLSRGPLLRASLLRLGAEEHVLLLTMHHIASDGWSMGIFYQELATLYDACSKAEPSPLQELPIQYADYALWQHEWLQGEVLGQQLAYWKQQLTGAPAALELPTDYARPAALSYRGARQSLLLPKSLAQSLKALSQQEGVTLFMTLLAAFQILLSRYSGQQDIVVGSPIAGRTQSETEGLIGFFVNTLVLRSDLSGNPTVRELLGRVREVALEAYAHQDVPFERLVEELQPERSLNRTPLFQVMFILQNAPQPTRQLGDLSLSFLSLSTQTSKFDLTLSLSEVADGLRASFEYSTDLFEAATITRLLGHFQNLLEAIAADPNRRLSDLPRLTEAEREQLLVEWNQTRTDYPKDAGIHQLFEAQVEQTPEAVAVVFEGQQLTYRELNRRANQLAHYLRKQGVGPEALVGICLERSIETVVALLGILKAGGAYVPLDPAYPKERLSFMLEDTQVPVLLTQQRLIGKLPEHRAQVICLDTGWQAIAQESEENPISGTTAENLAYVIYTSGSTGRPKGVAVPHRGVVRLVKNTNYVNLSSDEVFLQFAPISFDASTFEVWGCLLNGARLVVFPAHTPSLDELGQAIERHQVTTLWLTASLFHLMVDGHLKYLRHVRQLLAGGDVLSVPHVEKVLRELKGCQLINGYGPTESTTFTCCHLITSNDRREGSIPIGRPIANTQVYILDRYLQPVPVGVPGELFIGGDGLARGYLNRPELTQARFIPNPFSTRAEDRLYRTGDLVRYLPDGDIEFLGRIDQQVKIRGFRIELGEIEAALSQHPLVRESVVIAREDAPGDKRLVAYLTLSQKAEEIASELRRFLKEKLPDYMVPSAFVLMAAFPLSPNGKVDRRALPAPDEIRPEVARDFVAPKDELELRLIGIWEKVLGVHPVGVRDNFFDLGGHSLIAVRLFTEIEQMFGKHLPLATLFQAPTIEQLAGVLREQGWQAPWSSLVAIQPGGSKPPFFCIHPAGGNVLEYYDLARHLGPDQPFYALQPKGLDGKEAPYTRIEDMAADYLEVMRQVQPEGPYLIGGHSLGGNIAFEMAYQLQAQGQQVGLVALLDAFPIGYLKLLPRAKVMQYKIRHYVLRAKWHLKNLRPLSAKERLDYLLNKAEGKGQRIKHKIQRAAETSLPGAGSSSPHTFGNIEAASNLAAKAYTPRVYPGRVTHFCSVDEYRDAHESPHCWAELATGGVEIHEIPGDHLNIVKEPYVTILAERLKVCLDRAQEDISGNNQTPGPPSPDVEIAA